MSSAQLVILTSLVAIIRGIFSSPLSSKARSRLGFFLDLLIVGALGTGVFLYFKNQEQVQFYFHEQMLREWMQNNLGTLVFGFACAALIVGFRIACVKEWDRAFLKGAYEWLDPFMMAGTIALILITFFLRTYYIPSESMQPTLQVHDYIVVEKPFLLRLFHAFPPHRRDVVVFHPPLPGETREYIKRVIGLPGETLSVHDSKVYVNGKPLTEPYIKAPPNYRFGPVNIPSNHYIVFGDNRTNSEDSHAWPEAGGTPFLALNRIEGRAVLIFFPFNRIRVLHGT